MLPLICDCCNEAASFWGRPWHRPLKGKRRKQNVTKRSRLSAFHDLLTDERLRPSLAHSITPKERCLCSRKGRHFSRILTRDFFFSFFLFTFFFSKSISHPELVSVLLSQFGPTTTYSIKGRGVGWVGMGMGMGMGEGKRGGVLVR